MGKTFYLGILYSSSRSGWFCRACQEYSNPHDQYWKTVPRTHDQHPGVFFSEHENCQKHVRAVINKSNIKKSLAKSLDKKSFADLTLFVR